MAKSERKTTTPARCLIERLMRSSSFIPYLQLEAMRYKVTVGFNDPIYQYFQGFHDTKTTHGRASFT
ncbi:hypothetical protein PSEUDO8Z_70071 [Pseudomonas sp. 8Z]|nr:hypothetical protein PSEUDO8Z_70071 [Pseudomonas sp. 8Z]